MKTRLRFGIKLSWPITNAAIAIVYLPAGLANQVIGAATTIKELLGANGYKDLADRFICEAS